MHDAWAYVVFSALGTILYDIEPHLLYRIHDHNHVGIQRNLSIRLYRAGRYRLGGYMRDHVSQARGLSDCSATIWGTTTGPSWHGSVKMVQAGARHSGTL